MASKQILVGIRAQLVGVPPISQIQAEDLDRMAEALTVEYFAPGSIIHQPDRQVPQACYIIKLGVVRVERLDMPGD
jgi:signal-transduction protein with cAMP-binding, CBS, and nucleotidyltransferase domain